MKNATPIAVACVIGLTVGCYRSHTRETVDEVDAARRDAAVLDGSRESEDAGARPDAGPVLPPEPDPDLGPDARPSDYPDADDWDDVPPASDADPCCTMDEPILIEETRTLAFRPVITWGPGRWGILTGTRHEGHRAEIYQLAPDGHSLGPPVVLETPPDDRGAGFAADRGVIRWAEGRWALGIAVGDGAAASTWAARLYDADLRPASDWQALATSDRGLFDIARLSRGDRWVGVAQQENTFSVAAFSASRPVTVVEHALAAGQTLDAVGMRSRVAVLVGGLTSRPDGNAVVVLGAEPGLDVLGTVALSSRGAERASLTAVRDVVLAASVLDGTVTVEAIDPFAMTAVSAQMLGVVPTDTMYGHRAVDAIGSSKLGLAGVCYGGATGHEDPPNTAVLDFAVVGPDGARRGTAVRVTDDYFLAGVANCTVGTDDEGFLVAWWTGQRLWVRRIHLRE